MVSVRASPAKTWQSPSSVSDFIIFYRSVADYLKAPDKRALGCDAKVHGFGSTSFVVGIAALIGSRHIHVVLTGTLSTNFLGQLINAG